MRNARRAREEGYYITGRSPFCSRERGDTSPEWVLHSNLRLLCVNWLKAAAKRTIPPRRARCWLAEVDPRAAVRPHGGS